MIDKSKGYAFTLNKHWMDHPVDFYHGLYSPGSYAGEYNGNLIYLSGVVCKCNIKGREDVARIEILKHKIGWKN